MPAKKITTERAGRALAIKMLVEIEDDHRADMYGPRRNREYSNPWPLSIEAMYRAEGTQQDNIALRYLDSIRDCPEAMAGFCAVLTDHLFISIVDQGAEPWRDVVDLSEHEIHGTPGAPWPSMDDDDEEDPRLRLVHVQEPSGEGASHG